MKYKIIDNFLSEEECKQLINDGKKFINSNTYQKINVNRNSINSSSLSFSQLCLNSKNWNNLSKKLQSKNFFDDCFKQLDIDSNKYKLKSFYNNKNNSKIISLFKKVGLSQVKSLNTLTLLKYVLLRTYLNLEKFFKFNFLTSFNSKPLELLFDYSVAGKGYSREIHRDSDSRLLVFLIYFNKIDKNFQSENGGQLEIYRNKNIDDNSSQPNKNNCELIESIEPDVGKLIIFINSDDSFHAVKEIQKDTTERHFVYGAYTLLSGKNPYIKKSKSLKTPFNFYE